MTTRTDSYLVTEPGTTTLRRGQWLNAAALDRMEDRFGPSAFAVRSAGDVLDDWLTAPVARRCSCGCFARLIVLDALMGAAPCRPSASRHDADVRDANVPELCRQAITHLERLRLLRAVGAPEIVRANERRMLWATARALLDAAADMPPQDAAAA